MLKNIFWGHLNFADKKYLLTDLYTRKPIFDQLNTVEKIDALFKILNENTLNIIPQL